MEKIIREKLETNEKLLQFISDLPRERKEALIKDLMKVVNIYYDFIWDLGENHVPRGERIKHEKKKVKLLKLSRALAKYMGTLESEVKIDLGSKLMNVLETSLEKLDGVVCSEIKSQKLTPIKSKKAPIDMRKLNSGTKREGLKEYIEEIFKVHSKYYFSTSFLKDKEDWRHFVLEKSRFTTYVLMTTAFTLSTIYKSKDTLSEPSEWSRMSKASLRFSRLFHKN